jgi:hypothetical protein
VTFLVSENNTVLPVSFGGDDAYQSLEFGAAAVYRRRATHRIGGARHADASERASLAGGYGAKSRVPTMPAISPNFPGQAKRPSDCLIAVDFRLGQAA